MYFGDPCLCLLSPPPPTVCFNGQSPLPLLLLPPPRLNDPSSRPQNWRTKNGQKEKEERERGGGELNGTMKEQKMRANLDPILLCKEGEKRNSFAVTFEHFSSLFSFPSF